MNVPTRLTRSNPNFNENLSGRYPREKVTGIKTFLHFTMNLDAFINNALKEKFEDVDDYPSWIDTYAEVYRVHRRTTATYTDPQNVSRVIFDAIWKDFMGRDFETEKKGIALACEVDTKIMPLFGHLADVVPTIFESPYRLFGRECFRISYFYRHQRGLDLTSHHDELLKKIASATSCKDFLENIYHHDELTIRATTGAVYDTFFGEMYTLLKDIENGKIENPYGKHVLSIFPLDSWLKG